MSKPTTKRCSTVVTPEELEQVLANVSPSSPIS
jgi:hypothetical protein